MTVEPRTALRLQFLARVVRKECRHLATTDHRRFVLASALQSGHAFVPSLIDAAEKMIAEIENRGLME